MKPIDNGPEKLPKPSSSVDLNTARLILERERILARLRELETQQIASYIQPIVLDPSRMPPRAGN